MQGLRVHSKEPFATLFAPVFDALRGHRWMALCDAFQFPEDWLDESAYDDEAERYMSGPCADFERDVRLVGSRRRNFVSELGYYAGVDLFPRYAAAVSDEGCSIFALSEPPIDPSLWLEDYYAAKDRAAYLRERAQACLMNVDGLYWGCYAHDAGLLDTLRRHLQVRPDTALRACRLEDVPL